MVGRAVCSGGGTTAQSLIPILVPTAATQPSCAAPRPADDKLAVLRGPSQVRLLHLPSALYTLLQRPPAT